MVHVILGFACLVVSALWGLCWILIKKCRQKPIWLRIVVCVTYAAFCYSTVYILEGVDFIIKWAYDEVQSGSSLRWVAAIAELRPEFGGDKGWNVLLYGAWLLVFAAFVSFSCFVYLLGGW